MNPLTFVKELVSVIRKISTGDILEIGAHRKVTKFPKIHSTFITFIYSIQERELLDRFEFANYYDARQHIEKYMQLYNHIRLHGSLHKGTPA